MNKIFIFLTVIIVSSILITTIRYCFFDVCLITSPSMTETLIEGDRIIVKKFYSQKISNYKSYVKENVQYWDVIVFRKTNEKNAEELLVKRCVGLPGDTIKIQKAFFNNNNHKRSFFHLDSLQYLSYKRDQLKKNLSKNRDIYYLPIFPEDSSINWTLTDFGPLLVPATGIKINLNVKNIALYKDIIEYEMNCKVNIINSKAVIKNKVLTQYTFKNNYYFVLGDNFFNSNDSRSWGFISYSDIIGEGIRILYSRTQNGKKLFLKKRIFKKII